MFGENYMLGIKQLKLDEKGRCSVPSFTGVQKDDFLVILHGDDYLEAWNYCDIIAYLKEIHHKMMETDQLDVRKKYQLLSDQITSRVALEPRKVCFSEKLIRLNLGTSLMEEYQLYDGVIIEGKGKYIRIWNNQKFEEYQMQLKESTLQSVIVKKKVKKV